MGISAAGVGIKSVPKILEVDYVCKNCGASKKFYATFEKLSTMEIKNLEGKGRKSLPKSLKYKCKCGFEGDFAPMKNDMEIKTGKKLYLE